MAAVAGLPDGSVVLAGAGPGPDGSGRGDLLLAKLEPDGDLDPGFGGGDGWITIDVANRDDASSLALAPDGAILVGIQACAFGLHTSCSSAVARLTAAGTPDPAFGGGGVVTPVPGSEVAVAPDGSAYVAGGSPVREHFQGDFTLARLTPAGTLDAALSGDGIATADFGLTHDFAFDVGLGPDGPVLAGAAGAGYGVARFELEAGPADADADGVEDADDRCPQRFAGNSSGCPRIDRTAKVRPARRRPAQGDAEVRGRRLLREAADHRDPPDPRPGRLLRAPADQPRGRLGQPEAGSGGPLPGDRQA